MVNKSDGTDDYGGFGGAGGGLVIVCIYQFSKWARWWLNTMGIFQICIIITNSRKWLTLIIVSLLGFAWAVFLNVVIYRTPLMMEQAVEERMPAIVSSRNRY